MDAVNTLRQHLRCGKRSCACRTGPRVHCPNPFGHRNGDQSPSLTVNAGRNGDPVLHCHTGCPQESVIAVLRERGLWPVPESASWRRLQAKPAPGGPPLSFDEQFALVAEYHYRHEDGTIIATKRRYEHRWERRNGKPLKQFRWLVADCPAEEKCQGLNKCPFHELSTADLPLYNLPLLRANPDQLIIVVEGEKAADAVTATGEALGVCIAGSASTRRFGDALDPLRECATVLLFPDNDDEGKGLMRRIAELLPHAHYVLPPDLPEKGDVVDYLAAGGTIAALRARAIQEPRVTVADETITVSLPEAGGWIDFQCEDITLDGHSLTVDLRVRCRIADVPPGPYSTRVNLLSTSNRGSVITDLNKVFSGEGGKKLNWTILLSRVTELVRQHWLDAIPLQRFADIDPAWDEVYRVEGFLPEGAGTIIYADGGSGKTYLALAIALHICLGREFFGRAVRPGPVIYVDYEGNEKILARRVHKLCRGLGIELPQNFYYYNPRGKPLPAIRKELRDNVARTGAEVLIIDSAVNCAGGADVTQAAAPAELFNTLQSLAKDRPVTSLIIGHIPKDGGSMYGSRFYRNNARQTWEVKKDEEAPEGELHVMLVNEKINEDGKQTGIGIRFVFDYERTGPVELHPLDLTDISRDLRKVADPKAMIEAYLQRSPCNLEQLFQHLYPDGINDPDEQRRRRNYISTVLNRLQQAGKVTRRDNGLWQWSGPRLLVFNREVA